MFSTAVVLLAAIWTAEGMGIQVNSNGRPRDCQDLIQQGKIYEDHYVVYLEASSAPSIIYCSQDDGMEAPPSDRKTSLNCLDQLNNGMTTSGTNIIFPFLDNPAYPVMVYCDQETDGGGWTVIQKRFDGSEDFYKSWAEYTDGFGDIEKEHYLGNLLLSAITGQNVNELRVDLEDWAGETAYAKYQAFQVEDNHYFQLQVFNYVGTGTAGDSLTGYNDHNSGQEFSTFDEDHDDDADLNCAEEFAHGGWWYAACGYSNLNGRYYPSADTDDDARDGMSWHSFREWASLKSSVMMIRPVCGGTDNPGCLHDTRESASH